MYRVQGSEVCDIQCAGVRSWQHTDCSGQFCVMYILQGVRILNIGKQARKSQVEQVPSDVDAHSKHLLGGFGPQCSLFINTPTPQAININANK